MTTTKQRREEMADVLYDRNLTCSLKPGGAVVYSRSGQVWDEGAIQRYVTEGIGGTAEAVIGELIQLQETISLRSVNARA